MRACKQNPSFAVRMLEAVMGAMWLQLTFPRSGVAFFDQEGVSVLLRVVSCKHPIIQPIQAMAVNILWHLSTVRYRCLRGCTGVSSHMCPLTDYSTRRCEVE